MSTDIEVTTPEQTELSDLQRAEMELSALAPDTHEHAVKLDIVTYLKDKESAQPEKQSALTNTRDTLGSRVLERFLRRP